MKIKLVLMVLAMSLISLPLVFPKVSHAFWPFDGWFNNGQVKGDETTATEAPSLNTDGTSIIASPEIIPEAELSSAVKSKKITAAQKAIIIARQKAIKTKRDELSRLIKEFNDWKKSNKINLTRSVTDGTKTTTPPRKTITGDMYIPPKGCAYVEVKCMKAPCPKQLLCNKTTTPSTTTTDEPKTVDE